MASRNQKNAVYILILVLPFFIFFLRSEYFVNLRSAINSALAAPIKFLSLPLFEAKKILYYHRTFNEYVRLRQDNDLLRERVIGQEELIKENARLTQLLEFKRKLIFPSVAASVIGRNPSYWDSSMVIDKGKDDGIAEGMAVVTGGGVVGKIAEAGQSTSKVILLTDPAFSVAGLIQRPRETVLISGSLSGELRVRYVDAGADIKGGDKVVTSKLSTSFPESLLIGEVAAVSPGAEAQPAEYAIKPAVSLSQIEEVLVILK